MSSSDCTFLCFNSVGTSCFVNASKFKKIEVEEETETHSERLARIRMKRKIRVPAHV